MGRARVQSASEELQRAMRADALNAQLASRPYPEELQERGILKEDPGRGRARVQSAAEDLQRAMTADALNAQLASRPPVQELQERGIIKGGLGLSTRVLA